MFLKIFALLATCADFNQYFVLTNFGSTVEPSYTVCPRSLDPFYIGSYNIKWVKTSLSDSMSSLHIHFSFMLPCDI